MRDENTVQILGVGDLILDAPDMDRFFDATRSTLKSGDIVIGNIEAPHTKRPMWCNVEPHSAPAADPENLTALARAGFTVGTVGGNHCFDQGAYGILDLIEVLLENDIAVCGAGVNIDEARKPAVLEKKGIKFAFLHYNLTGPRECWASAMKTGCAYVRINTFYGNDRAEPGGSPSLIYTMSDPRTRQDMVDDIVKAKEDADVVIVYFHGGRPGNPALMQYELDLTHLCVDLGVQMVLCCHTHALSSVEVYRGKPIFYGLGNFVTVTSAMNADAKNARQRHTNPYDWPGVVPFWDYDAFAKIAPSGVPYFPFGEHARYTIIVKAEFTKEGLTSAGFIPCYINDKAQPEPVTKSGMGETVVNYLAEWTRGAGLNTQFDWSTDGSEIILGL